MEWVLLIIFLLFLLGRAQRSSPTHPANQYASPCTSPVFSVTAGGSSGDSFNSHCGTPVAGVSQPSAPNTVTTFGGIPVNAPKTIITSTNPIRNSCNVYTLPAHAVAPVCAPPPVAIQAPKTIAPPPVSVLPKLAPAPLPVYAPTVTAPTNPYLCAVKKKLQPVPPRVRYTFLC